MKIAIRILLVSLLLSWALPAVCQQAGGETPYLPALCDGSGIVKLLWPPPEGSWPKGGYILERLAPGGAPQTVAQGLRPNFDPALTSALAGPQQEPLKRLGEMDAQAVQGKAPKDFDGLKGFLFISAYGGFPLAQAMGLAWEDRPSPGGPYVYRLVDSTGRVHAVSMPLSPAQATPPAPPPEHLQATATPEGVKLNWDDPPLTPEAQIPVLAFRVKRDDGKGFVALGKGPVMWVPDQQGTDASAPRFLDAKGPQGQTVTYAVVGIDIFGRETQAAPPLAVSIPDFAASYPPVGLKAEPSGGKIIVTWKPSDRSKTAGYIIERAAYGEGPWEVLTPKLLPRSTARFEDAALKAGQRLYYRITAKDNTDRSGSPSVPVMVVARAGAAPAAPSNLRATLGIQRVQLAWDAVPNAVAYQVERTDPGSDRWTPAASHTTPEPRCEDALVTGQTGALRYRVIAVAGDNTMGIPSAVLDVPLPRNRPPSAPRITGFDGTGGRVTLAFVPSGDPADTAGFYILRGPSLAATPEVLQVQPIAASAREYTDERVLAGEQFVYRLVAVDTALNRSEASAPVTVRVGEAALSAPPAPRARFVAGALPKVVVTFQPAPEGNLATVQRRAPGETTWLQVAGPVPPGVGEASDLRPPKSGKASYRVFYKTPMGTPGGPSLEVEVLIPSK